MLWPFGTSGEQCLAFLLSHPPPVCTKVVGCVSSVYCLDWSLLFRECGQGLVLWSEVISGRSSSLVYLFDCSVCIRVMSCIGPQSPACVVGLLPNATCTSPHDHFDGISIVSSALLQLWLLAEVMFLLSLRYFGFRAIVFPECFRLSFSVGELVKTSALLLSACSFCG